MIDIKDLPVADVDEKHRFDEPGLAAYLNKHVNNFGSNLRVYQFQGGASNPTFLLETDGDAQLKRYVLRKKPPGKLLESAHQIDREYKFMAAIGETDVPVPKMRHLCEDNAIIGTMFYVMDFVEARIFENAALPDEAPEDRSTILKQYITQLASLHKIDYQKTNLVEFDRPGAFLERQVRRFVKQYRTAEIDRYEEVEAIIDYLTNNIPQAQPKTIFHGDFRLGNVMFHPDKPELLAVLDWELASIGDPLLDLAYAMFPWYVVIWTDGYIANAKPDSGLPNAKEMLRTYCELTGRDGIDNWHFYLVLALFRIAAISQGVYHRIQSGTVASEKVANMLRERGTDKSGSFYYCKQALALLADKELNTIRL